MLQNPPKTGDSTRNQPVLCKLGLWLSMWWAPSINRGHFLGEGMLPVQLLLIWYLLYLKCSVQKHLLVSVAPPLKRAWTCRWPILICENIVLTLWSLWQLLLFFFSGKHCREDMLLYTLQVSRESRISWGPRTARLEGVLQMKLFNLMGLVLV